MIEKCLQLEIGFFPPSWSNLEILINSIVIEICFTRGLTELNFKGEKSAEGYSHIYKAFGGGEGSKLCITWKLF